MSTVASGPAADVKLGLSESLASSPRTSALTPQPRPSSPCLDDFVIVRDVFSDSLGLSVQFHIFALNHYSSQKFYKKRKLDFFVNFLFRF